MRSSSDIKGIIKEEYTRIAKTSGQCNCGGCCCSPNITVQKQSGELGYSPEEMTSVLDGANLGLGCGNPTAIASLKEGDVVLDLGSGVGFDVFLAARRVGNSGKAIGVDMTDEMLARVSENAKRGGYTNVEFKKGDIENLPVEDNSIDVVISNCVINLAPDKAKVFTETYRVLKPGGRLMVSDVVLTQPLPNEVKNDDKSLSGCVAGAILKQDYLNLLKKAGFDKITVHKETLGFLKGYTMSITLSAVKR